KRGNIGKGEVWNRRLDFFDFCSRVVRVLFGCASGHVRDSFGTASGFLRLRFDNPSTTTRRIVEAFPKSCRTRVEHDREKVGSISQEMQTHTPTCLRTISRLIPLYPVLTL